MTRRSDLIVQATVTIQGIDPSIWRSLLLPMDLNFAALHHVLRAAFGWDDAHLHEFINTPAGRRLRYRTERDDQGRTGR